MARNSGRAEMSFVNELGNKITIWVEQSARGQHLIVMEGPSSRSTNEVTQAEIENLFRVLGAYLGAPVRPADVQTVISSTHNPFPVIAAGGSSDVLASLIGADEAAIARKPQPLDSHTDDGLVDLLAEACDAYEDVVEGLNESGGAGGSPLEGVSERVEEIVTVMRRRGLTIPTWATTPGGRRPKEN